MRAAGKMIKDDDDVELSWFRIQATTARELASKQSPPLVFLAFAVSGECPSTSQGCIESKYLPWYTEFTRVRVFVLIFDLALWSRTNLPDCGWHFKEELTSFQCISLSSLWRLSS